MPGGRGRSDGEVRRVGSQAGRSGGSGEVWRGGQAGGDGQAGRSGGRSGGEISQRGGQLDTSLSDKGRGAQNGKPDIRGGTIGRPDNQSPLYQLRLPSHETRTWE